MTRTRDYLNGQIAEEEPELTLADLSRRCRLPAERILELVEYGVIDPAGRSPAHWRFRGVCVRRIRRAERLRTDLGVNLPGVALALDLLEEIDRLNARIRRLED